MRRVLVNPSAPRVSYRLLLLSPELMGAQITKRRMRTTLVVPTDPASDRLQAPHQLRDTRPAEEIRRIYGANYEVFGARKVWRQPSRESIAVARCTVGAPDAHQGSAGRGKPWKSTIPTSRRLGRPTLSAATSAQRRPIVSGWLVVFVIDVCSRFVVGWQAANHLTDLALGGLEMALCQRQEDHDGLTH